MLRKHEVTCVAHILILFDNTRLEESEACLL